MPATRAFSVSGRRLAPLRAAYPFRASPEEVWVTVDHILTTSDMTAAGRFRPTLLPSRDPPSGIRHAVPI